MAAKMGSKVSMVSAVGDDAFGETTRKNFERCGIDASFLKVRCGMASGVAPIWVNEKGENRIIIINGANDSICPEDVQKALSMPASRPEAMLLCQFEAAPARCNVAQ